MFVVGDDCGEHLRLPPGRGAACSVGSISGKHTRTSDARSGTARVRNRPLSHCGRADRFCRYSGRGRWHRNPHPCIYLSRCASSYSICRPDFVPENFALTVIRIGRNRNSLRIGSVGQSECPEGYRVAVPVLDVILHEVGVPDVADLLLRLVAAAHLEREPADPEVGHRRRSYGLRRSQQRKEYRFADVAHVGRRVREGVGEVGVVQVYLVHLAQRADPMRVVAQNIDKLRLFQINHQIGHHVAVDVQVAGQLRVLGLKGTLCATI